MVTYADAPPVRVTIDIDAPPSVVWALVTDINLPAEFSDEFQSASWNDDAEPGLGAVFTGNNERNGRPWTVQCTVTEFEPERRFAYAVVDPADPAATWRFELEPSASGTTLTQHAQMGPGPSGVSSIIAKYPENEASIIEGRLEMFRVNMLATVTGIKTRAEA